MLDTPVHAWDDLEGIAALVRDHPWAVVVRVVIGRPVVSHIPILLDTAGADGPTSRATSARTATCTGAVRCR
ncbi:MAG: hypothetical protein KY457_09320 [Actinobacteria bacterium]|nr:hypothetical protein [Actinomycetota bacterium]